MIFATAVSIWLSIYAAYLLKSSCHSGHSSCGLYTPLVNSTGNTANNIIAMSTTRRLFVCAVNIVLFGKMLLQRELKYISFKDVYVSLCDETIDGF